MAKKRLKSGLKNNLKKKIIVASLSVVISLVLSEFLLRVFSQKTIEPTACRKPDPILDHSLVPNSTCRFRTGEWDVTLHINSQGFRGEDHSIENLENKYRILMLGDSFVEGYGVEEDQIFTRLIEKSLENKNVEVIAAGTIGWSPLAEYLYLSLDGLKYKPDLVVLNINVTDFYDDLNYYNRLSDSVKNLLESKQDLIQKKETVTLGEKFFTPTPLYSEDINDPSFIPFLPTEFKYFMNQHFYTYRYLSKNIKYALGRIKVVQINPPEDRGKIDKDLFVVTREKKPDGYEKLLSYTQQNILRMKNLVDKEGIKFMVVFEPHGHMVNGREWFPGRKSWGFEKNKTYSVRAFEDMARWAKDNSIETYDLTSFLRQEAQGHKLYFSQDGHWNTDGHRAVASAFLAILSNKIFR